MIHSQTCEIISRGFELKSKIQSLEVGYWFPLAYIVLPPFASSKHMNILTPSNFAPPPPKISFLNKVVLSLPRCVNPTLLTSVHGAFTAATDYFI